MSRTIAIDPVTRIEGHLSVHVDTEANRVVDARCSGEMFRGFEAILRGRSPLDAQQITQRICGVCPISHGIASSLAQEAVYGVAPPRNGRLVRNLILATNFIQSHVTHFYQLSALDFVDATALTRYTGADPVLNELKGWVTAQQESRTLFPGAPLLPGYEADLARDDAFNLTALRHYLEALEIRALCHRVGALFGGKMPHAPALVPGGITDRVTTDKMVACESLLARIRDFVARSYLPDVVETARQFPAYFAHGTGGRSFLSYGGFPQTESPSSLLFPAGVVRDGQAEPLDAGRITEDVGHSLLGSPSGLHPSRGATEPAPGKPRAYSWLKAPRYGGAPTEVGPLARVLVARERGEEGGPRALVERALRDLGRRESDLVSVMGRHLARAVEAVQLADACAEWAGQLTPDEPAFRDFQVPSSGAGVGLVEAPRGALGHWLELEDGVIRNYQCVVPTTWNCSPRDDRGVPGPVEQALVGTPIADPENPVEAVRVVRSFDPCLACAVH